MKEIRAQPKPFCSLLVRVTKAWVAVKNSLVDVWWIRMGEFRDCTRAGSLPRDYDDGMCGRYSLVRGNKIIEIVPNITVPANLRLVGRFNIAPTQLGLGVR